MPNPDKELTVEEMQFRRQLREVAQFAAVRGPYSSALFEATCAGARVNFREMATPTVVIKLLDERDRLDDALEEIARQRLRSEIEPIDGEVTGDFEGAYDTMIEVARKARGLNND